MEKISRYIKEGGFSLVEMLVVIFITALLSTLILANYHSGQQANSLRAAAQQLAADLRRVQNSALAVKTETTGVPYGYGLFAENNDNKYYLFYNTKSTPKYYEGNINSPLPSDTSQPLDSGWKVVLPGGVTFSSKFYRADGTIIPFGQIGDPANRRRSIYFEPPDPTTFIAGNSDPTSIDDTKPVRRDIILQSGSLTKTITIYLSGRIDIQ